MLDDARESLRERVVDVASEALPLVLRSRFARTIGEVSLRFIELPKEPRTSRCLLIGTTSPPICPSRALSEGARVRVATRVASAPTTSASAVIAQANGRKMKP
jgi:hypothetical protein